MGRASTQSDLIPAAQEYRGLSYTDALLEWLVVGYLKSVVETKRCHLGLGVQTERFTPPIHACQGVPVLRFGPGTQADVRMVQCSTDVAGNRVFHTCAKVPPYCLADGS